MRDPSHCSPYTRSGDAQPVRLSGWRTSTAVPLPIHSRASAPRAIYTPSQHSWRCGAAALSGPLRVCGCHLEYASTAGSYYSGVQRLSSIRPFSTARRNSSQNGRHRTAPHRTAPHRTAPRRVALHGAHAMQHTAACRRQHATVVNRGLPLPFPFLRLVCCRLHAACCQLSYVLLHGHGALQCAAG